MGEAFGEQFRDRIRDLRDSRMDHLAAFVAKYDPQRKLTKSKILEIGRATLPTHEQYDPAIWQEFAGIARAAGLKNEELLVANGLTDLQDYALLLEGSFRAQFARASYQLSLFFRQYFQLPGFSFLK